MARTIEQYIAENAGAFDPEIRNIQAQQANIDPWLQAQESGLATAKQNAFGDITNTANSRGMLYSGVPIEEQSRYVGERYLPALAGVKQQAQEQRFKLTSAINDVNQRKYTFANELRQKDLDREAAERQAAAQRAAAERTARRAAAASGYNGAGINFAPQRNNQPSGPQQPQRSSAPSTYQDWLNLVNQVRYANGNPMGWGGAAKWIEANILGGQRIPRGSVADQAFHQVFGSGAQRSINDTINRATGFRY